MQLTGQIIAVQEQRFRVRTATGQVYLLRLARDAPLEPLDLCTLQDRGATVTVHYRGQPNLESGVAYNVLCERECAGRSD